MASPKRNTVEGSGFSSLSTGDVLDKLVHASPRAHVELAGVPASVVLDTVAETSLISATFFKDKLAAHMAGVEPVGTFIRVFGVGPCEVPVEGYVQIPLWVFNQTVEAHFLVVKETPGGGLGSGRGPVLLGCNVLHQLKDMVVDPSHKDADAWNVTLQWYNLTKREPARVSSKRKGPYAVRTGRCMTFIPPREVRSVACNVCAPSDIVGGENCTAARKAE